MKRLWIIGGVFVVLFTLLAVRLWDVQMIQGENYLNRAERNRFYTYSVNAPRGVILDRYGDPLVWNLQKYYQVAQSNSLYQSRTAISTDLALHLLASTESASIVSDTERQYRYPYSLAHALGYVGQVTAEDLQRNSSLSVDTQIGKTGLERYFQKELSGKDGSEIFEINALGQKQRKVHEDPAQPGQNVQTTIDPYINELAYQLLGTRKGAVVVTDAETGEVIAMTSTPSFDPNLLSQTYPDPAQEQVRKQGVSALFSDPNQLFFDRAVAGVYPPGSTFKLITAFAGLESGKVNESTQVVDNGELKVGPYVYGNWYFREYGRMEGAISIVRAITRSNDIFFYKVAEWAGPDAIAAMARNFGLGQKTGIQVQPESSGLVPDPDWKLKYENQKWFLGDTYHYGIGQGDILASPIQIAQMTQAIGNQGSLCQVSLIHQDKRQCRDVNVQKQNEDLVLRGMLGACSAGGTAYPLFPYNTKVVDPAADVETNITNGAVVCKTGTAEFGAADAHGYRKTHALFTAIVGTPMAEISASESAQIASPSAKLQQYTPDQLRAEWLPRVQKFGFPKRLTITVLVESDEQNIFEEGSKDAAPIAKSILFWIRGEKAK